MGWGTFAFICLNASRDLIAVCLVFRYRCWLDFRLEQSGSKVSASWRCSWILYGTEKDSLLLAVEAFALPSSMSGTLTLEDIAALFLKAR